MRVQQLRPMFVLMVAAVLAAPAAFAESEREKTERADRPAQGQEFTPRLQKASTIVGLNVQNAQNKDLGEIQEIVLDAGDSRIAYAVLAFGGVLGMGEDYFAIPWSAFQMKADGSAAILNIDEQTLKNSKGFNKDNWPDMGDPKWAQEAHRQYGQELYRDQEARRTEGTAPTPKEHFWVRKLSELVGLAVKNREEEALGEINEIVVDLHEGRVAYAILGVGGYLGMGEKEVAVPWSALDLKPRLEVAIIDADKKSLEKLAFDPDKLPDLADRTYSSRLHEQFEQEPYWEVFGYVIHKKQGAASDAAWDRDSEYNRNFDLSKVQVIKGTVQGVETFTPQAQASKGTQFTVKTDTDTVTVQAGPESFMRGKDLKLKFGDTVTVTGSRTEIGGQNVLIASQITSGDKTVILRDAKGAPQWEASGLDQDRKKPQD